MSELKEGRVPFPCVKCGAFRVHGSELCAAHGGFEAAAIHREIDRETIEDLDEELDAAYLKLTSLEKELERARKALEFYAKDETWVPQFERVPYGSTTADMPMPSHADEDQGVTAKDALGLQCGYCGDDGEPPSPDCPLCNGSGFKALSHSEAAERSEDPTKTGTGGAGK